MSLFSQRNKGDRVVELFERMIKEGVDPDTVMYNTLMKAYGTDHKQAEGVLERMKKNKIRPDVFTHSTLMKARK